MSRPTKLWQAINLALAEELERDDAVMLLGEDIARAGGTFGITRGLLDRFGPERVRDTPISEQAMLGAALGASLTGMRPVCEILMMDFLGIASDQLVNQAAKQRFFSGGALDAPLVVRSGVGTSFGMGAQHSQALEGWYAHVPGLTVVWPSTPRDAKGLLKSAIRSDGPVLFLESLARLTVKGPLADDADELLPLGQAAIRREGQDVTIVGYGAACEISLAAAEALASHGVSCEVIDLRTVQPWDADTVLDSVARTNRCVVVTEAAGPFGPSAEIASVVAERGFDDLDAPVARVCSEFVPAPQMREYDAWRVPSAQAVADAVVGTLGIAPISTEEQR